MQMKRNNFMQEKLNNNIRAEKLNKYFSLIIGLTLLLFLVFLILILITANISLELQQVLIALIGLFIFFTIDTFKKSLEDTKAIKAISIIDNSYNYQTVNTYYEKQNLAEAASEIKELLNQLSKNHPPKNNQEEIAVANEAVKEINQDHKLQDRIIKTLKAGRIQNLIDSINHPLASFVISTAIASLLEGKTRKNKDNNIGENLT